MNRLFWITVLFLITFGPGILMYFNTQTKSRYFYIWRKKYDFVSKKGQLIFGYLVFSVGFGIAFVVFLIIVILMNRFIQ